MPWEAAAIKGCSQKCGVPLQCSITRVNDSIWFPSCVCCLCDKCLKLYLAAG